MKFIGHEKCGTEIRITKSIDEIRRPYLDAYCIKCGKRIQRLQNVKYYTDLLDGKTSVVLKDVFYYTVEVRFQVDPVFKDLCLKLLEVLKDVDHFSTAQEAVKWWGYASGKWTSQKDSVTRRYPKR